MNQVSSLYLHFPVCRHLCNYCDFYKVIQGENSVDNFHKYLESSIPVLNKLMEKSGGEFSRLDTCYIGGGTPSLWGKDGAHFFSQLIKDEKIELSDDVEFTMEVNPGGWTEDGLQAWREVGVNRYSLGIQSLNGQLLKSLDRIHSVNDVYQTLKYFSGHNLNFSVDFMLGLPFSDTFNRDVIGELDEVLSFKPAHLSLYILTAKGQYPHRNELPCDDFIADEYLKVSNYLISKGFDHYEVSNFALPGKFSRHNMRYWDSEAVAALGPSATGYFPFSNLRYKWKVSVAEIVEEQLSSEESQLEEVYMRLRTSFPVPVDFLLEYLGDQQKLDHVLSSWRKKGFVSLESGNIRVQPSGFLVLDSMMDDLFSV